MLGLVIDGGAAFAFRRDAQNAADMAAMAGANNWLTNHDTILAVAAARSVAASNGFSARDRRRDRGLSPSTPGNGTTVKVDITAPHRNYFSAIIGQPSWTVGTTATALTGIPNSAKGASPFIASIDAFNSDGSPKYTTPTNFGETNGDVPTSQPGHRLDELRDRQRQHQRGRRHHPRHPGHRAHLRLRDVHRSEEQRQPHDPVHQRRHVPRRPGPAHADRRPCRQLHGLGHVPRHLGHGRSARSSSPATSCPTTSTRR